MPNDKSTEQQTDTEQDVAVIGGGPGGYAAALRAAKLGARVTLIEKDRLGGTCVNRGCIPTKYLVKNADLILDLKEAMERQEYTGDLTVNFSGVVEQMNSIVGQLGSSIDQQLLKSRVRVLKGNARLVSQNIVAVNDIKINAKNIIIATGSKPYILPVPGANSGCVVTTDQILQMEAVPASVAVVGGNYVGLEFAFILNAMGAKVTVIEKRSALLQPMIDEEIARRLMRVLQKQGVEVMLNAGVTEIIPGDPLSTVIYESLDCRKESSARVILMATGRVPLTDGLGLAELGIDMNGNAVTVNSYMQTNNGSIYAAGDVTGKNMLAHIASYEGEIAADNALGHVHETDYRIIPSCVFIRPEIASVGINETNAKQMGMNFRVSKSPLTASSRAVIGGDTSGIVKMICDSINGEVIGLHIMGPHASDLIMEGALAMKLGAKAEDIVAVMHAHPTYSEAIREVALGQTLN